MTARAEELWRLRQIVRRFERMADNYEHIAEVDGWQAGHTLADVIRTTLTAESSYLDRTSDGRG